MYAAVRNALYHWLFQLRGPQTGTVVLVQRRIFILPTPQGLLFAAVLLLMLVGSINYALSLGFVLTFLLTALGVNAMVYTFRNLARLRVSAGRAHPVFVGETAKFSICIENPGRTERCAVGLTVDKRDATYVDVPARQVTVALVGIPARRRGRMRPGRLTLFTRYPLGLYYAWSYLEFDTHCLVYPRPAATRLPLPGAEPAAGDGAQRGQGREDFIGMRQYHPGDSPRHIAWKAAARGRELLTKQFSGRAETEVWFDWRLLPPTLGVEDRLSHLARWVLDAHGAGMTFGLRIPGRTIAQGSGSAQRDRCLEVLALFGVDDDSYRAGGG
ncbi:MAG TPA: DUF58 domain-containing protein [Burkholderiales bacterium]|nr:DUF58 domain-containing protein [Burkholderiales bacterium]